MLATALPILDPAAPASIVLGLTEGAGKATRNVLARRIAGNAAARMAAALLIGSYMLDLFGLSLPIVSVASGMIIAANAWRLLDFDSSSTDRPQALANPHRPETARTSAPSTH